MSDINLEKLNDKSLEILADIWDPYFALMQDKEFVKLYTTSITEAIKYACKNHQKEVIEIAEEYIVNPFKLPITLLTAIGTYSTINNDLFTSQDQNTEVASSGPATENTEADVQQSDS